MRIRTGVVFCLLLSFSAVAQPSLYKSYKRVAVGVSISPAVSYRILHFSEPNQWAATQREKEEMPALALSGGANLSYFVSPNLFFETGIRYLSIGYKKQKQSLTWTSGNTTLPTQAAILYQYQFIEIPLWATLCFLMTQKVNYYLSGGISTLFFIGKKTTVQTTYIDGHQDKITSSEELGYSPIHYALNVGVGIDYSLSNRVSIQIEPAYLRSFHSIVTDSQAKEYLYALHLTLGVRLRFFKE